MDLASRSYVLHGSQALSPVDSSILRPTPHSSDTSFPIIAIAIIGILATAFLLVGYYIFVIKCCLNWHRIDILRRFSLSRGRNREDPLMAHSPAMEARGLDESVIRSIPIFRFQKGSDRDFGERSYCECAVCLNEFQEDEKLRIIPNCSHVFHIDCIDVWLQNNANCPLCRTSISSTPHFETVAPSPSPQDPFPFTESVIGGDEDYVVIELGGINESTTTTTTNQALLGRQERTNSGELPVARPVPISPSPRKMEQRKKARKLNKVTSMGDECIDIRGKDEQFKIKPIRRSISMDSSADRQLYLAVQEIVAQQNRQACSDQVSPNTEGCSSSGSINGRVKRSFFSFGHGSRGSRSSAVLPVYLEP